MEICSRQLEDFFSFLSRKYENISKSSNLHHSKYYGSGPSTVDRSLLHHDCFVSLCALGHNSQWAIREAWLKDRRETWKSVIMEHTTFDAFLSIWFNLVLNGTMSPTQRSHSLLLYVLSHWWPQWSLPTRTEPNQLALWFPKGAPVSLWIWCWELTACSLNTQNLVFTVGYVL